MIASWQRRFIAAAAVGALACGGRPGQIEPERLVVYPPEPDTARIQYLTSITSELDFGKGGKSLLDKIVGRQGESVRGISKPYGLAVDGGKLFVCDQDIGGLDIVDLTQQSIQFFQPTRDASIQFAVNCFIDDRGLIYVTDTRRRAVLVYSPEQEFLTEFADEDEGNPSDVFVLGDRVYVSHLGSGLGIRVYARGTYEPLFRFPNVEAHDSTGLVAPANIHIAHDEIYASDMLKQRVLVYSLEGEYLRTIGRPGTGPSTFMRPKGVAVDREGLVYVVDAAFDNVQVFTPDGRLLMPLGGPGPDPGDMWLPAKIVIDYEHLDYFREYVNPAFDLKYLILVTNQYGPRKISVYGFVGPSSYEFPGS